MTTNQDSSAKLHLHPDFSAAPYVHPFNQPKYHAQILRAVAFAKAAQKKVYWCLAQDWPMTAAEEDMDDATISRMQDN